MALPLTDVLPATEDLPDWGEAAYVANRYGDMVSEGGAVLTESIFAWPGVGRLAFDAISNRDMPLINGCILLFATVFVVVNTAVDVLYALADPRIRYAG